MISSRSLAALVFSPELSNLFLKFSFALAWASGERVASPPPENTQERKSPGRRPGKPAGRAFPGFEAIAWLNTFGVAPRVEVTGNLPRCKETTRSRDRRSRPAAASRAGRQGPAWRPAHIESNPADAPQPSPSPSGRAGPGRIAPGSQSRDARKASSSRLPRVDRMSSGSALYRHKGKQGKRRILSRPLKKHPPARPPFPVTS